MGIASATAVRIWIVGFNDGGTFRLGAINCAAATQIFALPEGIASATAEGGAGGADSAGIVYAGGGGVLEADAHSWVSGVERRGRHRGHLEHGQSRRDPAVRAGDEKARRRDPAAGRQDRRRGDRHDRDGQRQHHSAEHGRSVSRKAIAPVSAANLLQITAKGTFANSAIGTIHHRAVQGWRRGCAGNGARRLPGRSNARQHTMRATWQCSMLRRLECGGCVGRTSVRAGRQRLSVRAKNIDIAT